jgi:hypothetical protein
MIDLVAHGYSTVPQERVINTIAGLIQTWEYPVVLQNLRLSTTAVNHVYFAAAQ